MIRSPSTAWRSPAWPDPDALLRIDAGRAGLPLSLTKPIGSGVLNSRHKATGEVFPQAVEVMTTLNAAASRAALAAGLRCATDVTGFGLLGHLFKLARASGVSAVLDHAAVPLIEGARAAARDGYLPGGSRRNLDWVAPHTDTGGLGEEDLLLLADAQTSGGLLIAGEIPGAPVIGELVPAGAPSCPLASRSPLAAALSRLVRPGRHPAAGARQSRRHRDPMRLLSVIIGAGCAAFPHPPGGIASW